MMNALGKTVAALAILFLAGAAWCGAILYGIFVGGFVVHQLWAWFVVSTFHVAALPISVAAGIMLLVSYTTTTLTYDPKGLEKKEKVVMAVMQLARPWIVLLIGWVITLFM